VAITDTSQTVVQDYQYNSFGHLKDQKNRIKQPYRFTGREWDKETGLYFYRARYYDAEAGRFISRDPSLYLSGSSEIPYLLPSLLKTPRELNPYIYTINNPQTLKDPDGLTVYYCYGRIRDYDHAYVCLDNNCAGLMPYSGCSGGGQIQPETFNASYCIEKSIGDSCCDQNKYEACIRRYVLNDIYECRYYGLITYNCVSWARDVIVTCQQEACEF
jgi:RHS repeat-associated protein